MDKHNLAFYFGDEQDGYPSGGFFERVIETIRDPGDPSNLHARLRALIEIMYLADSHNSELLDTALPKGTRQFLSDYRHERKYTERYVIDQLRRTLSILPQLLLLAFPDLITAVWDYVADDAVTNLEG